MSINVLISVRRLICHPLFARLRPQERVTTAACVVFICAVEAICPCEKKKWCVMAQILSKPKYFRSHLQVNVHSESEASEVCTLIDCPWLDIIAD